MSQSNIIQPDDPDEIFELIEEIATGSTGTVYKGTYLPANSQVAVKICPLPEDESFDDLLLELELLKRCQHPNIVSLKGVYQKGPELFISMEFCGGGAVTDIFRVLAEPLREDQIAFIARETLKALDYLHTNRIIHRDMKGVNILLTEEGDIKLVGFSVATQLSSERDKAKTFVGTPYWMSPEVIEAKSGIASYDEKADIWALGITCIELAEVNPPLSEITPMRALFQIPVRDPPKLQNQKNWSPEFHDFLTQALVKDPKDRKSAKELLQHPFVSNCKSKSVIVELIKRRQKAEAEQDGDAEEVTEKAPTTPKAAVPAAPAKEAKKKGSDSDDDDDDYDESDDDDDDDVPPPPPPAPIIPPSSNGQEVEVETVTPGGSRTALRETPPITPEGSASGTPAPIAAVGSGSGSAILPRGTKPPPAAAAKEEGGAKTPTLKVSNGKSTLTRPKAADRRRSIAGGNFNIVNRESPLLKSIIKQQAEETKTLTSKHHQEEEKKQKQHQGELAKLQSSYQHQLQSLAKQHQSKLEKHTQQCQKDSEAMAKKHTGEEKSLLAAQANEKKGLEKESSNQNKAELKDYLDGQKPLIKQQKQELKDRTEEWKRDLKKEKDGSKKAKQLSDLLKIDQRYTNELGEQRFVHKQLQLKQQKEHRLQQQQHEKFQQLQRDNQKQAHETQMMNLKQKHTMQLEQLNVILATQLELQQKQHPLEERQQLEVQELERFNLSKLHELEKSQIQRLLVADTKNQQREYRAKKAGQLKAMQKEQRVIKKENKGLGKAELKAKLAEHEAQFQAAQAQQDKEFEDKLKAIKEEEEKALQESQEFTQQQVEKTHEAQRQALKEIHEEQVEDLKKKQAEERQKLEHQFIQEIEQQEDLEMEQQLELQKEQFSSQQVLYTVLHGEQATLLQTISDEQTQLLTDYHKQVKEALGKGNTEKDAEHATQLAELEAEQKAQKEQLLQQQAAEGEALLKYQEEEALRLKQTHEQRKLVRANMHLNATPTPSH